MEQKPPEPPSSPSPPYWAPGMQPAPGTTPVAGLQPVQTGQYAQPQVYAQGQPQVYTQGQPQMAQVQPGTAPQVVYYAPGSIPGGMPGQPAIGAHGQVQQQPVIIQQSVQPQGAGLQMATPIAALNMGSAPVDCPACGQRGMTTVTYLAGGTTHAWAAVLCFCLCLGCIPYLMTGTKDAQHRCSKCGTLLATWHRSGHTQVHLSN